MAEKSNGMRKVQMKREKKIKIIHSSIEHPPSVLSLIYLFLGPSIYSTVSPSVRPPSIHPSSLRPSIHSSVSSSTHHPFIYLSIHPSILSPCIPPSLHPSSLYPFLPPSIHPSSILIYLHLVETNFFLVFAFAQLADNFIQQEGKHW